MAGSEVAAVAGRIAIVLLGPIASFKVISIMNKLKLRELVSSFTTMVGALLLMVCLPLNSYAQQYIQAEGKKDGTDNATVNGSDTTALGNSSNADGKSATALGAGSEAIGSKATAAGAFSSASSTDATSFGGSSFAGEQRSTALGANANAMGVNATAVGESALANGEGSAALGRFSRASGNGSVALGANSVADRDGAVSVGSSTDETDSAGRMVAPFKRQIINVADGLVSRTSSDAVTGGQLFSANEQTLSDAKAHADAASGAALESAKAAVADGDAMTLSAAKEHADAGDERTLQHATAHANEGDVNTLRSANAYTDVRYSEAIEVPLAAIDHLREDMNGRFRMQDRRIDQMGAMTAAMVHMASSSAGGQTPNRVAIGIGFQGGQAATSFGYQRVINARATMSIGAAFSDSERSAGAGLSLGW